MCTSFLLYMFILFLSNLESDKIQTNDIYEEISNGVVVAVPVEMVALAISTGIDCNNPGIFSEYCVYFNKMFKTFSAAHLVNFAY